MGANSFSATVESIEAIGVQLGNVASRFAGMTAMADTSRAQSASDSPVSAGALASFSETMADALQATVRLLEADRERLATVAARYRSVDERSAQSAEAITASMTNPTSPPAWSARRSEVTRSTLEGIAALDDVVVPAARTVTGAGDRVQADLRAGADRIDRNTAALGRAVGWTNPLTRVAVEAGGAAASGLLRTTDSVLEAGENIVRGAADVAEDLARRADRVLIRPTAGTKR
jgi:hypothetical protein